MRVITQAGSTLHQPGNAHIVLMRLFFVLLEGSSGALESSVPVASSLSVWRQVHIGPGLARGKGLCLLGHHGLGEFPVGGGTHGCQMSWHFFLPSLRSR